MAPCVGLTGTPWADSLTSPGAPWGAFFLASSGPFRRTRERGAPRLTPSFPRPVTSHEADDHAADNKDGDHDANDPAKDGGLGKGLHCSGGCLRDAYGCKPRDRASPTGGILPTRHAA